MGRKMRHAGSARRHQGTGHGFGAEYQGTRRAMMDAIWSAGRRPADEAPRCPYCGIPAVPENRDGEGRCRSCKDGTELPF